MCRVYTAGITLGKNDQQSMSQSTSLHDGWDHITPGKDDQRSCLKTWNMLA